MITIIRVVFGKFWIMRIQKWLSESGVCSRREAERLIRANKVFVNKKPATIGMKILEGDIVEVGDNSVYPTPKKYFLFNKPPQTLTMRKNDLFGRRTVMSFFPNEGYIFPVGRLDYDTTGVLLMTNDGWLTNKLLHPSSQISRVYQVKIDKSLTDEEINFLNSEKVIIEEQTYLQKVSAIGLRKYKIELRSGANHHVKKVFKVIDKKVLRLERIQFGSLTTKGLEVGQWRELNQREILKLFELVEKD